MLEEMIATLVYNRKRYLYGFLAFVIALLLVTVGLANTVFIAVITAIGYCLGSPGLDKKFKKIKDILTEKQTDEKGKN
ncbi:hypothetical protein IX317_002156 [Fusobacterium sp. DD29]|uniref:DUF2273 domain-containing protein n=1 Tax=unclassified Fusobacterium TaxID=2648384 RepID=UPI001B8C58F5|nr:MULTISPECIES: DUF2273 domain-containing protein [unclassified Fusobacterium]MBR8702162.1 hypothetical protein [Fusobacterium sp. DD45]MBR8711985.1 hypothetical protein [Fusobacterium sp. DD28]MBR8750434.1 hypothetical protein [Fusobacterium sp. DD29]MBR8752558.1 hypothetical protein [Fusobacterium sp. DD26]MBR8762679.1 hypothetical protein [Fusobacterium sp. DD25]